MAASVAAKLEAVLHCGLRRTAARLLRLSLASDERYRLWVPLKDISPQLVEAVLLHEDRWFYWHPGFNPYGLLRGAWITYVRHGSRQGGSTITMQLARLLWPLNTRTPLGKLEQVGRAVELELFYSKRQILEAYLNDAPYGRNVEGVGAASLVYFDKPVATLSLPEALTLAVIPQEPGRNLRNASETRAVINRQLTASRNRLYAHWLRAHPKDASLKPLFALPLAIRPLSALPFEAPHAVEQVLEAARVEGGGAIPHSRRHSILICSTSSNARSAAMSRATARTASATPRPSSSTRATWASRRWSARRISSTALAGPGEWHAGAPLAGLDAQTLHLCTRFRSGRVASATVFRDVPTAFGPYAPENFDGRFLGPITATDALNRSRNIPAVWVASQLHAPDLYQFLQGAGIGHLASEQHYGLALVLGGGEVSMQELAGLYAMLANRGVLKPLRLRADEPQSTGTRAPERGGKLHGDGHAAPACPPRRSDRRAAAAQSRLLEDRHVLGLSRCMDGRKLRALCARRLGRQFRRLGQSRFCRRRCGGAALLPDRRRDRSRTSALSPSPRDSSRPISNAWRFASRAASFPIAGVRKRDRPGSFPANRRSA